MPIIRTPLVSALCYAADHAPRLERAIECFLAQTHPSKELVVAYPTRAAETRALVERYSLQAPIVGVPFESAPQLTRGEIRNRAVLASRGEYFCAWEEQDWHQRERIELQIDAVRRAHQVGCLLSNVLLFDPTLQRAYFSHFRPWEASVLVRRDVFDRGLRYPALNELEDMNFVRTLVTQSRMVPLVLPGLYIRALPDPHTRASSLFVKAAQPLSSATSTAVSALMNGLTSVHEGSDLLRSPALLSEYKYFYLNNITGTQRHIEAYRQATSLAK
jgi:hypothetical protein